MENSILYGRLTGYPIRIVCKHDNGEQVRKHKKKRINKKWRKRYGCFSSPLMPGQILLVNGEMLMSRKTFQEIKRTAQHGKQKGLMTATLASRLITNSLAPIPVEEFEAGMVELEKIMDASKIQPEVVISAIDKMSSQSCWSAEDVIRAIMRFGRR